MITPTTAAILAGGRSERMGQDKANLIWQGEMLLARTARIAQETGCRVLVVGRERSEDWPQPETLFLPDTLPGQGPLGGLATALQYTEASGERVLALACDLPQLSQEAFRWLLSQDMGPHGVAVRNGEQWEPLFSLYTPRVLPLIRRQLDTGRRALQALLTLGDFCTVVLPPEFTPVLKNVNTPEEFAEL